MNRPAAIMTVFSFLLCVSLLPAAPQAQGAESLRRKLDALKKTSPGSSQERDLQKEIIRLVRGMRKPPALPEEADRHMARGEGFVESGKNKGSFERAAREFREAARLAPWLAQAYYNLGVVQEKAGNYDAAMESMRMYLFAAPDAPDARKVKRLIYKFEARKEEAKVQEAERRRQESASIERQMREWRQKQKKEQRRELAKRERIVRNLAGMWCNKSRGNGACIWRLTPRGDSFELSYISSQGSFKDYSIYQLKLIDETRIAGELKSGMLIYGACGNRPVFYSVPVQGRLSRGRTSMALSYTKPRRSSLHSRTCSWTHSRETESRSNRFVPR